MVSASHSGFELGVDPIQLRGGNTVVTVLDTVADPQEDSFEPIPNHGAGLVD